MRLGWLEAGGDPDISTSWERILPAYIADDPEDGRIDLGLRQER